MPSDAMRHTAREVPLLRQDTRRRVAVGLAVAAIFALALALRLYRLDTLPAEWYGDITIVHDYVAAILAGQWPFYYQLSAGPLYHYLIAPLIAVLGYSYLSYKCANLRRAAAH